MDRHTLDILEFPAILFQLAQATTTARGAELAEALLPSSNEAEVRRLHTLTDEAISLLAEGAEPSFSGVADVRDPARRAARGAALTLVELSEIRHSINVALAAKEMSAAIELTQLLRELLEPVEPALADPAGEIARCLEADGSALRDQASRQLRQLRRELRTQRHRAAEELTRVARSKTIGEFLQENFITERGGRPVLAVKISARGRVPGIIHDSSGSGQTLFVEPLSVVELNNRLAEIATAEREEAERIVRELSALVAAQAEQIVVMVEACGAADVAIARGALSRGWRGSRAEVAGSVRFVGARHPLLDTASVVPVDLDLGELRALVVSGPNTGGKTVALKTIGLFALLNQAGFRLPADSVELPVFDQVLADIGDEQSIEMSLSTFSAHLRNIVGVLDSAGPRSLVLLDELAAGTDPVEGSALAQALVARLAMQARLTVVTTHYPELKEWASATDGAANASTGFDAQTYAPLYEITLGRPGMSQALRIAERLGLERSVVADALNRVSPDQVRLAELLIEAEANVAAGAAALKAAELREAEAALLAENAERRQGELEHEIASVRASAAEERRVSIAKAERELEHARGELEAFREELRLARQLEATRAGSVQVDTAERERDRRLGAASEHAHEADRALHGLEESRPMQVEFSPGDPVVALDVGVRGTITAIESGKAEVIGGGGLRLRVPLDRLGPDLRPQPARADEPGIRVIGSALGDVSDQLDVRGTTAQEAREAVRSLLDQAALAGLRSVHVIHGRGTGVLRAAVREEIARHQLVERYEADSADGATIVHLA
ncbi:MAG: mismatch repair protein MutS2 [Gaiellaceae bacterium]|nr:mismatch repair protein MutS2 [Gaiellaceae bacterium]